MTVYERLQQECKRKGMSITLLCSMVTGSTGNLKTWKVNKGNMRSDYLLKCAEILGTTTDYLLGNNVEHNYTVDFYRTLLSDEGIKAIKRQLNELFDSSEDDLCKGLEGYGISLSMMRQFFHDDISIGHDVLSKLDTVLLYLDTNVYDLIKKDVLDKFKDFTSLYNDLDTEDRAEIRGEMKAMLRQNKYKNNEASVINDIADEMKPTFKKTSVES